MASLAAVSHCGGDIFVGLEDTASVLPGVIVLAGVAVSCLTREAVSLGVLGFAADVELESDAVVTTGVGVEGRA